MTKEIDSYVLRPGPCLNDARKSIKKIVQDKSINIDQTDFW